MAATARPARRAAATVGREEGRRARPVGEDERKGSATAGEEERDARRMRRRGRDKMRERDGVCRVSPIWHLEKDVF